MHLLLDITFCMNSSSTNQTCARSWLVLVRGHTWSIHWAGWYWCVGTQGPFIELVGDHWVLTLISGPFSQAHVLPSRPSAVPQVAIPNPRPLNAMKGNKAPQNSPSLQSPLILLFWTSQGGLWASQQWPSYFVDLMSSEFSCLALLPLRTIAVVNIKGLFLVVVGYE